MFSSSSSTTITISPKKEAKEEDDERQQQQARQGGGIGKEGGKQDMRHKLKGLEADVRAETEALRRIKLVHETLAQLVTTKARNDEVEDGKIVHELLKQNSAIRVLIDRVRKMKGEGKRGGGREGGHDPAAMLKVTDEVLSILNLPPPALPPNVVRIAMAEGERRG